MYLNDVWNGQQAACRASFTHTQILVYARGTGSEHNILSHEKLFKWHPRYLGDPP